MSLRRVLKSFRKKTLQGLYQNYMLTSCLLGEKAKASLEVGSREQFLFYHKTQKSRREGLGVGISNSGSPLRYLSLGAIKFILIA